MLFILYATIATVIYLRRSTERMPLFTSLFLVVFGTTLSPELDALSQGSTLLATAVTALMLLGQMQLLLFLYLFPSATFVPRWTRAVFLLMLASLLLFPPLGPMPLPDALSFPLWATVVVTGLVAQIYRYRRVSSWVERQQTKWVVFGIAAMIFGLLFAGLPRELFPALFSSDPFGRLLTALSDALAILSLALLPVVLGASILRYRLWDIDLVINRTLVYGGLSAAIIAIYALIVGVLGTLIQANGNFLISLLGAAVVAILFQPVRDKLQRTVNRVMYGERDDPYGVLSRLSNRLATSLAPDEVLSVVTETVRDSLRLPYVELKLRAGNGEFAHAACAGIEQSSSVTFPLVSQNETLGLLLVSPRAPDEPLSDRDQQLLQELARQTGAVIHATLLNTELQQARTRLVTLREEERRRIRRDLHDGLGPVLASIVLEADAARDIAESDPGQVEAILTGISARSQAAIADVRQLVYGLRPPSLDELGLLGALRLHIQQAVPHTVHVQFNTPDTLPSLSAAVEVACFRIVQEAVNNVVRHADATRCVVELLLDDGLWLIVEDDGRGIAQNEVKGVGLHSMRERAEELGGRFVVESGTDKRGTRIRAFIPLDLEA